MAIAWKFASTSSVMQAARSVLLVVAAALALGASPAHAEWKGNLALGYSKLFISDAPGGGFALAMGVNQKVNSRLRLGPVVGYHLLGTSSVADSSANANVDYSLLEIELRADWQPSHLGPLRRISFGPSLTHALADISSSSAGLAFEHLAVSEWKGGLGVDLALLPAGPRPVAVGLEAGVHMSFVASQTWTVGTLRLVLEY
ncbi:MAG: hypothetical protein ACRENS_02205 [Candidatus Eiseniibacteriota bacterium]